MKRRIRRFLQMCCKAVLIVIYGRDSDITQIFDNAKGHNLLYNRDILHESEIHPQAKLYSKYRIINSTVGRYTYISENSYIHQTAIGSFCSIGPNLLCGWGLHPTTAVSTSPMFYSDKKQNGVSFSQEQQIFEETASIIIENDVFIGMNVTILDGVTIGNGAIVGAGSIVIKDVPPYAIVAGNPAKIIKFRFEIPAIENLLDIKWWEWDTEEVKKISTHFWDVDSFISKYSK